VTGGGSNIGRGIVLGFAGEGSNVVVAEIDRKQGQKTVDDASHSATSLGGKVMLVQTDVTDWDSVRAMVEATVGAFGRVDVLVNNVGGGGRPSKFVDKPREEWTREIELSLWSVMNCTRAVVEQMIGQRYGKIVNIGSPSAQSGLAGRSASVYGAAKGGVISLSKALAWELGPHGINVNVVVPGWTLPGSSDDVGEASFWKTGMDIYSPEMMQGAMKHQPIQRLCMPEDVARAVIFLASDCASYLTGQTLSVTGGATMW